MKILHILPIALLCSMIAGEALGEAPSVTQAVAWSAFKAQYGPSWTVRWDPETGSLASLSGGSASLASPSASTMDAGRYWLAALRDLLGTEPSESTFAVDRQRVHFGIQHTLYQQCYRRIPIIGGELTVSVSATGALRMVAGKVFKGVTLSTTIPRVSERDAQRRARIFMGGGDLAATRPPTLTICPTSSGWSLAYRVDLYSPIRRERWRAYVEAIDGHVLDARNVTTSENGRGSAFASHPPGDPQPTPQVYTIQDLLPNQHALWGTKLWIDRGDYNQYTAPYAWSPNRDFIYSYTYPNTYLDMQRDTTHMDEINLYYHGSRYLQYLAQLGWAGPPDIQIQYQAHTPWCPPANQRCNPDYCWCTEMTYDYNNAVCDYYGNAIYFGDGDRINKRDAAKSNTIIYHETQHYAMLDIGLGDWSDTTQALQEGYADYFACSVANSPLEGEWWTRDCYAMRDLENTYAMSDWFTVAEPCGAAEGSPHARGQIWSGALWNIRSVLGSSITDALTFAGIYYRLGNPSFLDARDGLVQADLDLYGGAHASTITQYMAARGIGAQGTYAVTMSGPTSLPADSGGTYTASMSGATAPVGYVWRKYRYCQEICYNPPNCPCGTWQEEGTGSSISVGDNVSFKLRVEATDARGITSSAEMVVEVCPQCPHKPGMPGDRGGAEKLHAFALAQSRPNPFNRTTEIRFELPTAAPVRLEIFGVNGRLVRVLTDKVYGAGTWTVRWNRETESGGTAPAGVYFCRIQAGAFRAERKMAVLQ